MKIQKNYFFIIFMMAAVFVLSACGQQSSGSGMQGRMGAGMKQQKEETTPEEEEETQEEDESKEADLYIVTKIDAEQKKADFQKVEGGRQLQYAYDTGTRFLDKYGDTKAITSFLPGDVVEIEVIDSKQQLVTVQLSDQVWVHDDIVNYSVDESIHAVTIGQTIYSYNADMDIFSGEGKIGFAGISSSDVLRAVGMGQKLISLAVTKGHGYLALANTKLFEGSFICIGDRIFEEVTQNMQIEVPEGSYLVTVANKGYGGSREIAIERDQTTSLNLDELKGEGPKICKVTFDVGVEHAILWVDGKKADYSAPVELPYGVHTIAIEAEGFDTITKKLVVNSEKAEIEVALNASSSKDDSEKEEKKNNNNNNNNNNGNNNNNNNSNNNNNNSNGNNNNNNNNNGNNNNNNNNNNSSAADYLTTLYNLLTSTNQANQNTNNNNNNTNGNAGSSSNSGDSYEDLRDQ